MSKIESIVIAGPCSAQSREQVIESAEMAKLRGITHLRASLEKPRTVPGFDGVGEAGIPWMKEVAMMGIVPATEVLTIGLADKFIEAISGELNRPVLPWLGSRKQDHKFQQEIGQMIKGDPNVRLLIKNQPWEEERHWLGIVEHVIKGGADPNQIIVCHRGFAPGRNGYRNKPNFQMAMRVKEQTGLPMLVDPSHIGGKVTRVFSTALKARDFNFDGMMVEVHPSTEEALTDKDQQLSWNEFDSLMDRIRRKELQLVG